MAISTHTRRVLWGRSGGLCARCQCSLIEDPSNGDREALVGQECHIVSTAPRGPRYGNPPAGGYDSIGNLLLLCGNCHTKVDAQPTSYTPERLRNLKTQHEKRMNQQLLDTEDGVCDGLDSAKETTNARQGPSAFPTLIDYLVSVFDGLGFPISDGGVGGLADRLKTSELKPANRILNEDEDWPGRPPDNVLHDAFEILYRDNVLLRSSDPNEWGSFFEDRWRE